MRPAFLIIDMQREFLTGRPTTPRLEDVVEQLEYVAGLFRAAGRPVVIVHDVESCAPGSPGYELVEGLGVAPGDHSIDKVHGDAFRETGLDERLAELGVDYLVVGGFMAEACVLSTLKGAEARDIPYAVLRGGIVSTSADGARFVEGISPLASHHVVAALLRASAGP